MTFCKILVPSCFLPMEEFNLQITLTLLVCNTIFLITRSPKNWMPFAKFFVPPPFFPWNSFMFNEHSRHLFHFINFVCFHKKSHDYKIEEYFTFPDKIFQILIEIPFFFLSNKNMYYNNIKMVNLEVQRCQKYYHNSVEKTLWKRIDSVEKKDVITLSHQIEASNGSRCPEEEVDAHQPVQFADDLNTFAVSLPCGAPFPKSSPPLAPDRDETIQSLNWKK